MSDHSEGPGPTHQRAIYIDGVSGVRPAAPVRAAELERLAERAMTPRAWAYVAGGAGMESTLRANRDAFDKWKIVPRMLRDTTRRDLSVELFGQTFSSPLMLAPIGALGVVCRDADLLVARAAAAEGVPMIFSNQAGVPMEQCAAAMGSTPRWFQLYWNTSNDVVASFVRRAEQCGCSAIVLTLDTTRLGWRARDLDFAHLPFQRGEGIAQYTSDPVFRSTLKDVRADAAQKPKTSLASLGALISIVTRGRRAGLSAGESVAAVRQFIATASRPSLTWADLPFLRSITKLPIVLKGIQHPDDARRAADEGINGIVVSNHGGRQVDGAIGSLDALPEIVRAVGDRMPVLFDSGIRSGADAFKALALGARAVFLGRPFAFGLAVAGERGVREVIRHVLAELDVTLGLAGQVKVRDVSQDALFHAASAGERLDT